MKTIILVRHATAVKRSLDHADFNRSLKKSGRKEAEEMAALLKARKARPKLFISSPANRAFETASIFAGILRRSAKKIEKRDELYTGLSPREFLDLIRGIDDKHDSAVIFGHDPTFTDFAQFLVPGFDRDMPKAGVLGVEADAAAWKDVAPETARQAFFFHPGDNAAPALRRRDLRKDLETRIEEALEGVLTEFRVGGRKQVSEEARKLSARLAKKLAPREGKKKRRRAPKGPVGQGEEEQG